MTQIPPPASLYEIFSDPVHVYTRARAIDDGVLVNLSAPESDTAPVCRQHYKYPIACTMGVFELMRRAVDNPRYCHDYAGLLHDMLWMSRVAGRKLDASTVVFRAAIAGAGRARYYDLKLAVGPGDQGEPVITLMLPSED